MRVSGDPTASAQELARLDRLLSYEVLDTPPDPAFDDFTALASRLLGVPIALISLLDQDRQRSAGQLRHESDDPVLAAVREAAARAGIDTIDHGTFLDTATINAMKAKGTWLVPTMLAPRAALAQARAAGMEKAQLSGRAFLNAATAASSPIPR